MSTGRAWRARGSGKADADPSLSETLTTALLAVNVWADIEEQAPQKGPDYDRAALTQVNDASPTMG